MSKTKVEYTEEQLADIKEKILEDRQREHRAIAGDQAFRLAVFYVARDVNSGLYDQELLRVLAEEWDEFKKKNPVLGKKEAQKPPESEK
jgi:hypothetical protein